MRSDVNNAFRRIPHSGVLCTSFYCVSRNGAGVPRRPQHWARYQMRSRQRFVSALEPCRQLPPEPDVYFDPLLSSIPAGKMTSPSNSVLWNWQYRTISQDGFIFCTQCIVTSTYKMAKLRVIAVHILEIFSMATWWVRGFLRVRTRSGPPCTQKQISSWKHLREDMTAELRFDWDNSSTRQKFYTGSTIRNLA